MYSPPPPYAFALCSALFSSCICRVAMKAKKRDKELNTITADMDKVHMILCGAQLLLADFRPTYNTLSQILQDIMA